MSLRWEKMADNAQYGFSGELVIGMVGQRSTTGRWWWRIEPNCRHLGFRGKGEVKDVASALRAADKAWSRWLAVAALQDAKADAGKD